MKNVGFRIYSNIMRPPKELVEGFTGIPVANIADNMNRMSCIDSRIRNMNEAPLLGTAFTVKSRPGDNLMLNKAIDMAAPGDVIIVDAAGETSNSVTGEMMITWAQQRGIAGFIIDGAVRDAAIIRKMNFPVYAAGVTPKGPYKDGPGEINVSISCGGVVINPGDIIVGDGDGVVVIDPKDASELLEKAKATVVKEMDMMKAIKNKTWDRRWVDKVLHDKECDYMDSDEM
ncbi:RraA family protein [Pelosinus fermentans]|uniref:Putative 4-hydroxy-4-methyl-2-oxoglutarate aldolase n=1 Tax=Pelosinus fermentans JBW45 TaxID=1192197 RepID=I8TZX9_9FIRM|nr:RraA family protein [Pelosinus fermentans]AJQ29324.1 Dimethylmenaquinone methyltransferase [Pelosinus fermentans JBW45]